MVGTQLCRHGVPIRSCQTCRSSKRTCAACREIRYAMHVVWLPRREVESREIDRELVRVESWFRPPLEYAAAMFPLCQRCWRSLDEAGRLEHFRQLWLSSGPGPQHLAEWFAIEAAVLASPLWPVKRR